MRATLIQIEFQYYADCPSHEQALSRLRETLSEYDIDTNIEVREIKTQSEAEESKFIGSPTILINGKDIQPYPENTPYALTCRAYYLENGRVSPMPSQHMIREALSSHINEEKRNIQ